MKMAYLDVLWSMLPAEAAIARTMCQTEISCGTVVKERGCDVAIAGVLLKLKKLHTAARRVASRVMSR
jgi:hypothetical protein